MVVVVCLALLGLYNFSFWQQLGAIVNGSCIAAVFLLLFCFLYAFFTLVNYKYFLKPSIILFFLIATLSAYAMDTYGFVVSTEAFQTFAETDFREIYDLLNWKLAAYIVFLFIIPTILILKYKYIYPSFKHRCMVVGVCFVLIAGDLVFFNKNYASLLRNHKAVRYYANPLRPIYSMFKYAFLFLKDNKDTSLAILDHAPQRIRSDDKHKLVILVVGESDRAINQQLNGYQRNTNPLLAARNDVLSFNKVYSCGTETSVSVPCMFSVFPRENYTYSKGKNTENVLDLLQKSAVNVLWRDNDSGCKGVCDRVELEDFNHAKIAPYCNSFECHDQILLHELQNKIDQRQGDQLIVLHKKGNHGPAYYKRYPDQFKQFLPTCDSNELQDCTDQQIVNTYDNIILYTDYFLDQVINILEQNKERYQTAMIYISDHGESLGEKGVYLHAMPYWIAPKEQIHVPLFMWISKDFDLNRNILVAKQNQPLSHDHLFHTLLGMYGITSPAYVAELDVLR